MKHRILAIGLSCVLFAFSSSVLSEADGRPDQVTQDLEMNTIVFTDHSLNRTKTKSIFGFEYFTKDVRVSVQNKGIKASPTGMMEVWVILKNHADYPVQVEGRATFFESSQAPAEPQSAWKRVNIPPNSTGVYQEFATSRNAAYFQVEFREGR